MLSKLFYCHYYSAVAKWKHSQRMNCCRKWNVANGQIDATRICLCVWAVTCQISTMKWIQSQYAPYFTRDETCQPLASYWKYDTNRKIVGLWWWSQNLEDENSENPKSHHRFRSFHGFSLLWHIKSQICVYSSISLSQIYNCSETMFSLLYDWSLLEMKNRWKIIVQQTINWCRSVQSYFWYRFSCIHNS